MCGSDLRHLAQPCSTCMLVWNVQAYREDLLELPRNGWSLLGLGHSLKAQGKAEADVLLGAEFPAVWKDADVSIETSCPVFSHI